MTLPPLKLCCSPDNQCWAAGTPGEPCWGEIHACDEDYPDDPDLRTWVHTCDGHANAYHGTGPYELPLEAP